MTTVASAMTELDQTVHGEKKKCTTSHISGRRPPRPTAAAGALRPFAILSFTSATYCFCSSLCDAAAIEGYAPRMHPCPPGKELGVCARSR
jgi:hypothetical protein